MSVCFGIKFMITYSTFHFITNRFHVAVRLFSNRSQMTLKCGKNKKVVSVTNVLTTFWRLLWSITESGARQHGIYLFYIITKSLFYFKIFQYNAKAGLLLRLCPAFARKKSIWRDLWSIQNEAISLVAMRSRGLWLVRKNRATVKPWLERRSSLNEKLQRKRNWTAKSTNLEENAGKIKSGFVIGAVLWAEKLGRCLENYKSWKNTLGKLVVMVNLEGGWMKGV